MEVEICYFNVGSCLGLISIRFIIVHPYYYISFTSDRRGVKPPFHYTIPYHVFHHIGEWFRVVKPPFHHAIQYHVFRVLTIFHFRIETLGGHVEVMKKFYTQLHHNLTRTIEIANMMFQKKKLTHAEHEEIFQDKNVYTINEILLKLILDKPPDVYDCFLEALKRYNQTHLYQLLRTSGYLNLIQR